MSEKTLKSSIDDTVENFLKEIEKYHGGGGGGGVVTSPTSPTDPEV